ncbi:unnamed protein product, partial [Rotaria sordida]
MEHSCVRLDDLPDEILLIIFQKLNNCDVLYSFMGLNERLDTILYDKIFTINLSLIKYVHGSSYQFNIILDRFSLEILPKINDKIERLSIESSFIKRILLATNYPNLHALDLYEFEPETASTLFRGKIFFFYTLSMITYTSIHGPIIDGDNLENNIINHMTRLNKFTFNICSVISLNQLINVPLNEDIKYSFRNFQNNQIISSVDYFSRAGLLYCHVYSYPYTWTFYQL